jgi:hypothetical protein
MTDSNLETRSFKVFVTMCCVASAGLCQAALTVQNLTPVVCYPRLKRA